MSNFDIFNKESLLRIIDPFAPGMTDHITPIKYEAITPDIFALLFRTSGSALDDKREDHYFVSLEFDYIDNLEKARKIIEEWYGGKVIEFWDPENVSNNNDPRTILDSAYQALLAKVERPRGSSYWASNEVIFSPDEIEGFIVELDQALHEDVRVSLEQIFRDYPGVSISVYIDPDGQVEYFYS